MAKFLYIVFTKPVPGKDDEFNDWYIQRHLDDVLAADGFTAAQLYSVTPVKGGTEGITHPYMAIYEIEGDGWAGALENVATRFRSGLFPITDALDQTSIPQFIATPISTRLTK